MKQNEQSMEAYEAPRVKVIEVEVEQGFAMSDPYGSGNHLN